MSTISNLPVIDLTVAAAVRKVAAGIAQGVVDARRTCLGCIHFQEPSETCLLYNMRPPARVIAFGCEAHCETVPF